MKPPVPERRGRVLSGSFTTRLALRQAALVITTAALVLVAGAWLLSRQMARGIDALHEFEHLELVRIIASLASPSPAELSRRIQQDADSDLGLYYIQVHDVHGSVFFRSENLGSATLPAPAGNEQHTTVQVPGLGMLRLSEYYRERWHIQIASPLVFARQVLSDYVKIGAALVGAVALVSIVAGWALALFLLRPVRAIRETALRIRGDNLRMRIPVPAGGDELAALIVLLNQMFDRLEASFHQASRFTADASHELRTPLTLIRLNAENLRQRLAADPEAFAQLGEQLDSIARLQRIVESLLFLAKAEAGAFALRTRETSTAEVLAELTEDATALCEDRGVHFLCESDAVHSVRCDAVLVRQLLLNLVSNAVRVAPPGTSVALHSVVVEGDWVLRVRDDGPGLPTDQLERIFERFVRLTSAGTADEANPGHGLGLALCRSIAEIHGGTIRAENRAGHHGLVIEARWPAAGSTAF